MSASKASAGSLKRPSPTTRGGPCSATTSPNTWWPRWRDGHPHSAYLYGKRIEKRILPAFGNLRFVDLDADVIGDWKAKMLAEQLAPHTVNAYLSLLATILNAAVDSDYLPRSPMRRKSQAGRAEAVKKEKEPRREVWVTRGQLDRLAAAINPRYRALVLAAALTGLRWGRADGAAVG